MAAPTILRHRTEPSAYDGACLTFEEFLTLPPERPELEYFGGRAVQKAMAGLTQGDLQAAITALVWNFATAVGGHVSTEVDTDFFFPDGRAVRIPDVAYWAPGKPRRSTTRLALPPTLAVEIRSPGETIESQRRKCRAMRGAGVDVCWLFLPRLQAVEVFDSAHDGVAFVGETLTSEFLPGLALDLPALWAIMTSIEDEPES